MNPDKIIGVRTDKIVYRDGGRAIKVFDKDYSKANILNEALNQARMEETSLNIPKIIEVTTIDGKWAIISEFIKGKTLAQLMEEQPEKAEEYLNLFVNLQMKVHTQKAPLLNKLKDKMNRKISQAELNAAMRYDLHTRLDAIPNHTRVCHGDFNPSNIIVAEDGEAYILDWSHATQGNVSADVAKTYLLFWLAGDIEGAHKYLDLYCEKSHTPKQCIQEWLPIVAVSQMVKNNTQKREFLLSWVNVVDYE